MEDRVATIRREIHRSNRPGDEWMQWVTNHCSLCGCNITTHNMELMGICRYCPKCGAKIDLSEFE